VKEEMSAMSDQWRCNEVTVDEELTSTTEVVTDGGMV
jgi:hypothetical protein